MLTRRNLLLTAAALPLPRLHGQDRRELIQRRASMLASYAGEQLSELDVDRADRIAEGFVFFNKRTPVKVGLRDIDWSGGHVHHQEWPAQLNRFFHLAPLASAYAATKKEKYAAAARAYIEDWMRGDPYPNTQKRRAGDSALSMSIRLGTSVSPGWTGNLQVFLPSPSFNDAFLDRMLASLAGQSQFAAEHLAVGGNWYISQLDALVFISLRLPFLKDAGKLLEIGISRMRHELTSQFLDDGVHIERTPSYHDWMTSVAVNYFDLARRFPEADAQVNPQKVVKSLDYSAQAELAGFNDSHPPAELSSQEQIRVRRESLAVIGLASSVPPSPPLDQVFPNAGQVFSRTGWDRDADYLAFDAASFGSTHTHLSRLSFTYRKAGRVVVADPGTLSYEMSDPLGPYGKSTLAHSTVSINGWNQSSAAAQLVKTDFTPDTTMIHASYRGGWWNRKYGWGFEKGNDAEFPVVKGEHDRILFWVKREYLVIIDRVTVESAAAVHNGFQMGQTKWNLDQPSLRWAGAGIQVKLVIAPVEVSAGCFEGSKEPPRGWIGFGGKDPVPAPYVEYRYRCQSATPTVTWIVIAPENYQVSAAGPKAIDVVKENGATDRIEWRDQDLVRRLRKA